MTLTADDESNPSASVHETTSREPTGTLGSGDDD